MKTPEQEAEFSLRNFLLIKWPVPQTVSDALCSPRPYTRLPDQKERSKGKRGLQQPQSCLHLLHQKLQVETNPAAPPGWLSFSGVFFFSPHPLKSMKSDKWLFRKAQCRHSLW